MQQKLNEKESEVENLNDQMLELQDEKLDFQSKLENNDEREHNLKEEIVKLMDTISGKDMAITQLSE
jgi:chromosome segregation ATPase